MIRLIILFAIFLAVYPMIGDGWAQFSTDFNVQVILDNVSSMIDKFKEQEKYETSKQIYPYLSDWYVTA